MRDHETAGVSAADSLTEATALQQSMWPEVPCSAGPMLAGWTTSAALFSSPSALEEFLDYEGSFDPGVDLKSRAAFLMSDYCYIFSWPRFRCWWAAAWCRICRPTPFHCSSIPIMASMTGNR